MNVSLKSIDSMIVRLKKKCVEDIIRKVKTQEDKLDAMNLIYIHQLYPISNYIKIPKELDSFVNEEWGIVFERYSTISWTQLLDHIDWFLDPSDENFEKEKIRGTNLHFEPNWYKLSTEEIYSKCIDILYQFMIDNKISGCYFDW